MRTIFAEYNPNQNSIDVYTNAGYMLRIDCWEAEKDLKTTPGSDCALNALVIDETFEYALNLLVFNSSHFICKQIFSNKIAQIRISNLSNFAIIRNTISAITSMLHTWLFLFYICLPVFLSAYLTFP